MKNRFLCIHGHFYQPPRENPWLNEVELQDSAYPYHDWNDRITAECYARNSASRILDGEHKIIDIVNNYSKISFNFGPTLLSWMENNVPDIYEKILEADQLSLENFSGHGSAIAQAYNHMIMPLTNKRDKETQVKWGIRDFESRFRRKPEGMWCGETAMNTDTLEVLADHDIKFTILSPYQAKNVRLIGKKGEWKNVEGANVDPRRAYLCNLPSGKSINIFFYDGPVSQGIAFEGLLNSGEEFANRLMQTYLDEDRPQLMNIATDGETYGHHHEYGEMALSYCLHHIESEELANITIYGEYLENFPPEYEVEIIEDTSWSCYHGVERWRSNCGCNTGGHGDWTQEWRGPLRDAFDWLRDKLIPTYEEAMKRYHQDPWKIRNEYIQLILDRSRGNVENFLQKHFSEIAYDDEVKILKLLEMQFHAMLMYTSCGWFFDEVTGIETMQDIAYASRTIQLAEETIGLKLEEEFIDLLRKAPSNIPKFNNAGEAYIEYIKPSKIDINRVGAHYAISSLFSDFPENYNIYSFYAHSENYNIYKTGRYRIAIGRAEITSQITWEKQNISFAIMHIGEHNVFGGVRAFSGNEEFGMMHDEIKDKFYKNNIQEIVILMDKYFGMHNYSFWHLFKEDQKMIMDRIMIKSLKIIESSFSQVYDINYPLLHALNELNLQVPKPLKVSTDYIVNAKLSKEIKKIDLDLFELKNIIDEIEKLSVELDYVTLNFISTRKINKLMDKLYESPENTELMLHIIDFIRITKKIEIKTDFWEAQNTAYLLRQNVYQEYRVRAKTDPSAKTWCDLFDQLYETLNLKPD